MPDTLQLSVVVLAWENEDLTARCVDSLRTATTSTFELIVVDNGSGPRAAALAKAAADKPILHASNLGFAAGMNSGLQAADAPIVAFVNNDTAFPAGWDDVLVAHFTDPGVGLVVPAVTAAGNPVTVRSEAGSQVLRLLPFGEFPSGVVYLARRSMMPELGGWNEDYPIASAEDLDLCFTIWANGLDIVLDTRVLIEHVNQASVRQLPNRKELYANNLDLFLRRWSSPHDIPRLETTPPDVLRLNLGRAQTAVRWIDRMLDARREAAQLREELTNRAAEVKPARTRPLMPGRSRRSGSK